MEELEGRKGVDQRLVEIPRNYGRDQPDGVGIVVKSSVAEREHRHENQGVGRVSRWHLFPAIGNSGFAPHRPSNWIDVVLDDPTENLVQLAVGQEPRVRRDLGTVEFQLQAIVEIDSECLPVLRLAFRV